MVTTKTIRCVSRRVLLAFLASAGVAGVNALPAAAQSGTRAPVAGGPVSNFGLEGITLAPGETIVSSTAVGGATIDHGGGTYQIIDSSSVPTASGPGVDPMLSGMPMMAHPQGLGGYSQHGNAMGGCATGNCGGGYGTGGGGASFGGAPCGPVCDPYLYASLEGLYIMNDNIDNYSLSPNFVLDDFDYEMGLRGTIGMVPDCRNGMEISFVTPIEWESQNTLTSPGGGIGTFLTPNAPFIASQLSTFSNANFQSQQYEAEYYSFEANQTVTGWEVCKLLHGIRYLSYDEDYFYRSANNLGQGLLQSSTQNQLIGFQIGIDMTYPLTCKIWSDFRGRAGVYGNFAENTFQVINAGTTQVRSTDNDIEIAGMIEFGGGVRYYVNDDFFVRAGAELWYIDGVAVSQDQYNSQINLNSARNVDIDGSVLMVGLSLGAELKF